ncbi:hypothetical protein PMAYCL1PPCAC_04684, partial [Pristionchus mayeri]
FFHLFPHMSLNNEQDVSAFIADALKGAFISAQFHNYTKILDEPHQPPLWETWGVGLLVVCGCSFSAPLGMILLPFLSAQLYDRVMTFLTAVGIGALSGSCFFVMLPQAFELSLYEDIDYEPKSWIIICALYTFLCIDRTLQYMMEIRRRIQGRRKIHTSTLEKLMRGLKSRWSDQRQMTEETDVNETEKKEMEDVEKELEMSMLSNAFSRTFSTRRRVAMVTGVDGIEITDKVSSQSPGTPINTHKSNGANQDAKCVNSFLTRVIISSLNSTPCQSPLGTRKAHQIIHNAFLDQVNEKVKNHLQ